MEDECDRNPIGREAAHACRATCRPFRRDQNQNREDRASAISRTCWARKSWQLVNPTNPNAEPDTKDVQAAAANSLGRDLRVFRASTERDFETAFAAMVQLRVGALLINVDPFFIDRREQIIALAARHAVPAMYDRREFPVAGGLMSYGASEVEAFRQCGIYIGRILKGAKPADLPVQQAAKFEFVINLKTAKGLGLDIPPGVLAIVDEVVE
jgi:putative ABC transport system substrate-binding protein